MKTVATSSRGNQKGMIRLAVLASIFLAMCLLFLSYHSIRASVDARGSEIALRQSPSEKSSDCGCSGGTGVAGYTYDTAHKHLRVVDAAIGNTSRTASEDVPGAASDERGDETRVPGLYAVIVEPGQQVPLATTSPLPLGPSAIAMTPSLPSGDSLTENDRPGGFWTATYGKISPDGKRYTAPTVIPPFGGVDVVEYTSTGTPSRSIPPNIAITFEVRDPKHPHNSLFPCLKTLNLPLTQIDHVKQSNSSFAKRILKTAVMTNQSGADMSHDVKSIGYAGVMGYILPSWSDWSGVQVYVPSVDPATGLQVSGQTVCRIGPRSGPPAAAASGFPVGYKLDTDTSANVQYVQVATSGWTTVGKTSLTLSIDNIAKINADYKGVGGSASFGLKAGGTYNINLRSMSNRYKQFYFIDHYHVTGTNKHWIWDGTSEQYQYGVGNLYDPLWYSSISGYPPSGAPVYPYPPAWQNISLGKT